MQNIDIESFLNSGNKNQYEGNYQESTKNYLQALEALYQILDAETQNTKVKNSLTSLRASILSNLGDNFVYVGQHKIALEFYNQQLRIVQNKEIKLDIAFAYHKVGFCYYFIKKYESAIEFQEKSLKVLSEAEENLELKRLKCKINLCLGLNQLALERHEVAMEKYEEALDIARRYGFQKEEAEIIANLSLSIIKNLNLEHRELNFYLLEKSMGDLYYAVRISGKSPYIQAMALWKLARVYELIDINIAQKYFEDALKISNIYSLYFSKEIQDDLYKTVKKIQASFEQDYILEEQDWYCLEFPKTIEIDKVRLKSVEFDADFVIVTATSTELKYVACLLESCLSEESFPLRYITAFGTYYLGIFGHYKTVVTKCRMGTRDEHGAGFVTQKAVEFWNPKAIIMVGIAFGKSSTKQKVGDVLVATEIIDYEVNRIGLDGIVDRGSRPPSNRSLLGLFEQAYEWEFSRPDGSLCKLIPGSVLSGDKLVDNPEFKADLFRRFPHAKGGEMEGMGFCSAANSLQKPWILIKAICDWADGKKNDKYQPLAAAAAASLVHYVLSQKTILNCFE